MVVALRPVAANQELRGGARLAQQRYRLCLGEAHVGGSAHAVLILSESSDPYDGDLGRFWGADGRFVANLQPAFGGTVGIDDHFARSGRASAGVDPIRVEGVGSQPVARQSRGPLATDGGPVGAQDLSDANDLGGHTGHAGDPFKRAGELRLEG